MTASTPAYAANRKKELGAFYTPRAIAEQLVEWAIQSRSDSVLDPSFGSMVFLEAAADRLRALGVGPCTLGGQLYGIEIDDDTFSVGEANAAPLGAPSLIRADFLGIQPGDGVPTVSAVVGNPPYLRYQSFNARRGCTPGLLGASPLVSLTRLASSWASFVVHAVGFVEPGGRLAHVLPGQLLDAQYARAVRDFLAQEFGRVTVVAFEERVFPNAQEQVVLVCAEERGAGPSQVELLSVRNLRQLRLRETLDRTSIRVVRCGGDKRGALLAELLPTRSRRVYARCEKAKGVARLGALASVDIGTVTGANAFFVMSDSAGAVANRRFLTPAVSKAAHVPGARFTNHDLEALRESGERCQLLLIPRDAPDSAIEALRPYLNEGEALGLHKRNKCRSRAPWWSIKSPRQSRPDLLLTYCAHDHPRLILNEARVMNTNTLHSVVVHPTIRAAALAAGFYNSLTMLSSELLARSYGGGVLKLEPTEAEALLIPPLSGLRDAARLLRKVDAHVRAGNLTAAQDLIDPVVLEDGLGLSKGEIDSLRNGAEKLRQRRHSRRRVARNA